MMRRLFLALALCAASLPAGAWLIGRPVPPAYVGPGDIEAQTAWYSCTFGYSAAVAAPGTTPACDFRRVSDNDTCTALVGTDGLVDYTVGTPCNGNTQTVTVWIGASSARATKAYDQTGGTACDGATSCDTVQATAGLQPLLVFTCGPTGTLACLYSETSAAPTTFQSLSSANTFTPSAVLSVVAVFNYHKITGTPQAHSVKAGGGAGGAGVNNSLHGAAVNVRSMGGSGATRASAATDDVWHNAIGILSAALPGLNSIDGTDSTTSTTNADTTASAIVIASNTSQAGSQTSRQYFGEGGFEDNAAWSSGTRTALCHNMRLRWGTGGTC